MLPGSPARRKIVWSVLAATAAIAAAGCVRIEKVDPGRLTIDDFEDGDVVPFYPRFKPWRCAIVWEGAGPAGGSDGGTSGPDAAMPYPDAGPADAGPGPIPVDCAPVQPGYRSDLGLIAAYEITNPPGEGTQTVRVDIVSTVDGLPLDLSGFERFGVSARIGSTSPSAPTVEAELLCGDESLTTGPLPVGAVWARFEPSLADLLQPRNSACVKEIDGIRFTVRAFLVEGQTVRGSFGVDEIYLDD